MKQLSLRLSAPLATVQATASRLVQRTGKPFLLLLTLPQRLVGRWRLFLNYCPECNSCAPKLQHCDVCCADTKSHFHWSKETEQAWWKRYVDKHRIAA